MCLWVLIGHTCRQTGMNLPVLRSPHYAVDGFMILSGFLMTYHALLRSEKEPWRKGGTWASFYIRRVFRISPLYYLLLVPAYLFSDCFLRWRSATDHFLGRQPLENIQAFSPQNLLWHLTYVFGLLPQFHASTVLPDWSLSLEMQFYFVFPLCMLFVLRFGWLLFTLGSAAIWLSSVSGLGDWSHAFLQPSPLPLSLLWFVIGMVWASAYLEPAGNQTKLKILGAGGLALLSRDLHDVSLVAVFGWILFSEGQTTELVRRALSAKLSNVLARASYSVYLLHLLILTPVAYFLCIRCHIPVYLRFFLALATTAICSYGLARPLEAIENWGIAEGKRFSKRVSQPASKKYKPGSFLPDAHPVDV